MLEGLNFWNLAAGLGIFLFGMMKLEEGLQALSSNSFRKFLRHSTSNRVSSVASGIVTTAIVQSSSMVSLMVLALVGAGIIPLYNAIGVVIGANLGTTFTGWIVATVGFKMNVAAFALPLLGGGAFLQVIFPKATRYYNLGKVLLGFGLLVFGLDLMKTSIETLADNIDIETLRGWSALTYLLVGVVFTAIIQSSSATMMIALSALNAGILDLPSAAALVIGADLGTTSTTALGALKGSVTKKQVAMAHILFNVIVNSLAFITLLPLIPTLAAYINLEDPLYTLVAFHSFFNLMGVVIFLPLLQRFSDRLEGFFTDDEDVRTYIQNVPPAMSQEALIAMEKEVRLLVNSALRLNLMSLHIRPDQVGLGSLAADVSTNDSEFAQLYSNLKRLEGELLEYAAEVQGRFLEKPDAQRLTRILHVARRAVYSTKNLKDVRRNLKDFKESEPGSPDAYYLQIKELEADLYAQLFLWQAPDSVFDDEDVFATFKKLEDMHDSFARLLYTETLSRGLNEEQASTLLNVNLELQSSARAMIESIQELRRLALPAQ